MRKKKIIITVVVLLLISITAILVCDSLVKQSAEGKLYNNVVTIPYHNAGLLLGTSKYLAKGGINPYYANRIDATVSLLKEARIKYVIVSGDNGTYEYNEPEMMRQDLIKAGVDSSLIFLDYAGFRTFDSMVRLKEIFGQSAVTVISQPFHNERAMYIARRLDIDAVGFNAKDVSAAQGLKTQIREKLARVKVVLDFIFGNKPKFLGTKVTVPADILL